MAHDIPLLTWNVCWPVAGGIPWHVVHDDGGTVVVVTGTVVGTVVVVAGTVVEIVVGAVVGPVVVVAGTVVVVAGTVVETVVGTVAGTVVVVGPIVVVGATVVVGELGSGLGSQTFQLRLETWKLIKPAFVTVGLSSSVYVVPVTV